MNTNVSPITSKPATASRKHQIKQAQHTGRTLRDYFAGQVAVGMMSEYWNSDSMRDPTFEDIALSAYALADAMLAAREKS